MTTTQTSSPHVVVPAAAPPYSDQRIVRWAGYLTVFIGAGHVLLALALTGPAHLGAWTSRAVWGDDVAAMSPADGAYWFSLGSFGLPQAALGLLVLWLDRRGLVPPSFVAWSLVAVAVPCGVIFGPAPWFVNLVAAGLLLLATRRAKQVGVRA